MTMRLPWPLPALVAWTAAWALLAALRPFGPVAPVAASSLGLVLARWLASTGWRRAFIALGFPLSLAASGLGADLPAWGWLAPLGLLLALYPLNAWGDAPLFPTPAGALRGLARLAPLPPGASVLDGGCGLGAGLRELRRAYPEAALAGLEWSRPLAWLCRFRCRGVARVRRGDLWAVDWSTYRMVYLFQRPESVARAWDKACAEMAAGDWLASLEFPIEGVVPSARLDAVDGRPVWLYRVPVRTPGARP